MKSNYYLYRHKREDNNEIFYVGIGTKRIGYDSTKSAYDRATTKRHRSNFWKRITGKTKYQVEIVMESSDLQHIKNKEIEFIKLYGRRDLKTGTLCNMTRGGDGVFGWKPSKDQVEKRRQKMIGYKHTKIARQNMSIGQLNRTDDRGWKEEQKTKLSVIQKERIQKFGLHENCVKTLFKKGQNPTRAFEVLDKQTGIFYAYIQEAALARNYNRKRLSKLLKSKNNSTSLILLTNELQ